MAGPLKPLGVQLCEALGLPAARIHYLELATAGAHVLHVRATVLVGAHQPEAQQLLRVLRSAPFELQEERTDAAPR